MASKDHTTVSRSSSPKYEIVKHVMIDIENEPEDLKTTRWNIYRVPCSLRNLKPEAYTPQLVSIGPLHYGHEKLNPMQKQKLRYFHLFWGRIKNNTEAMDDFKRFLEDQVKDIRQCYAEELCGDEKLVEMMLLDSVFIMELFLRIQRQKSEEDRTYSDDIILKQSDDIILKQSWLNKCIQRDLLLLENQIPLFILEMLYKTVVPEADKMRPTFIELAYDYFDCFHIYKKTDSSNQETGSSDDNISVSSGFQKTCLPKFRHLQKIWDKEPQHFTDLIRSFYICEGPMARRKKESSSLRTATKLQEAGVSIEKVLDRPLLDIKFQKVPILSWFLCLGCIPKFTMFEARFEIPQLRVDHTTGSVLSNIMVLELCRYPNQTYVCEYVSLFNSLLRSEEDIKLLVEKEVISHTLRSDMEVKTLVYDLCRNIETEKTCYKGMIDDLNKHYQRMWWNRNMATLRFVYFRDLWRASSTIVGLVVFMFTVLNIYQAIRSFHIVKK